MIKTSEVLSRKVAQVAPEPLPPPTDRELDKAKFQGHMDKVISGLKPGFDRNAAIREKWMRYMSQLPTDSASLRASEQLFGGPSKEQMTAAEAKYRKQ